VTLRVTEFPDVVVVDCGCDVIDGGVHVLHEPPG
jgi:hypothetical protein